MTNKAERQIAADIVRAARRTAAMDAALSLFTAYLKDHPDATPDDAMQAMGPVLSAAIDKFVNQVWGVLVEELAAAVEQA